MNDINIDYLKKIIFYFLTMDRTSLKETESFLKLKHNKDLCPALQRKFESLLSLFSRYRRVAYDVQGIKDEGSDVFIRYYINGQSQFICTQIKSYDDLNEKGYLKNLKSQYVDSINNYSSGKGVRPIFLRTPPTYT